MRNLLYYTGTFWCIAHTPYSIAEARSTWQICKARVCLAEAHGIRGFPPSSLLLNHLFFQILTSEKAFICLSLYNTVRLSMTLYFPSSISSLGEAKVSVSRIRDFLLMEERGTEETSRAIHALNSKVRLAVQTCCNTQCSHFNVLYFI